MEDLKRKCPHCATTIVYGTKSNLNNAIKKKQLCRTCSNNKRFKTCISRHPNNWILSCSRCNNIRTYKSYQSFKNAEYKTTQLCGSCSGIVNIKENENAKLKISNSLKGKMVGDKNPFYGKNHTKETKQKIRNKHKQKGNKNGMFGKTVFDIWVKKYGIEEANERLKKLKTKLSLKSSGKNNNMYGKPSPQGSGNGWSGWYKKWFFRSLIELSYMINVIETKNVIWETGESKKYMIKYTDYEGKTRNYFPDFIIDNKYMVECKPKKLHITPNVLVKKKAAEKFCLKNNLEYKLIDIDKISFQELTRLHKNKSIVFTDRYEEKFKNYKNQK